MDELLLGVLAPALRGHGGLAALHDLEQRLLHALARHVARDGKVFGLASYLVYLVDVDDADLGTRNVEVRRRNELEQDVLHVLAHVARLGQRGGVRDGEGHPQRARKRLRQKGLARSGGAEQHDVALGKLHVALLGLRAQADALVMVVYGHRKGALGILLTNHVLGKVGVQLVRRRQAAQHRCRVGRIRIGGHSRLVRPVGSPCMAALRGGRRNFGVFPKTKILRQTQPQVAHHGIGAHRNALVADVDAVRA